jgi:hypothetical protein
MSARPVLRLILTDEVGREIAHKLLVGEPSDQAAQARQMMLKARELNQDYFSTLGQ